MQTQIKYEEQVISELLIKWATFLLGLEIWHCLSTTSLHRYLSSFHVSENPIKMLIQKTYQLHRRYPTRVMELQDACPARFKQSVKIFKMATLQIKPQTHAVTKLSQNTKKSGILKPF